VTPQEQCEVNLRAIALAQRLVAEKREPTPGERGALMAYTGFGSTDVRKHALSGWLTERLTNLMPPAQPSPRRKEKAHD
jgi:hypothetical protein